MRLVPLAEGGGVDLDDGALDESVCADELVVRGVVLDAEDARLPGRRLGAPAEVARLEAERTELEVASPGSDGADAGSANLGHGCKTHTHDVSIALCGGTPGMEGTHQPGDRVRTFSSCGSEHAERPRRT